jgi:hypothetical protein
VRSETITLTWKRKRKDIIRELRDRLRAYLQDDRRESDYQDEIDARSKELHHVIQLLEQKDAN